MEIEELVIEHDGRPLEAGNTLVARGFASYQVHIMRVLQQEDNRYRVLATRVQIAEELKSEPSLPVRFPKEEETQLCPL